MDAPPSDLSSSARPAATRGQIFSWTLFDFANTAFSVVVVTVIYSRYFTNHVAGGQRWLWGLAVSISMVLALLLASLASVLCTALLYFVEAGMIAAGIILFVIANIGFEGGLVFYDAFLPSLTSPRTYGRVSGYGFAMGYLGALAVLLLVNAILPAATDPSYLWYVRFSFVIAALFFLVFSIPMFLFVPEPAGSPAAAKHPGMIREGLRRANHTFQTLFVRREHPSLARFLIAFFIYNDGILTIIAFAAIFAEKILRMSDKEIIVFFAVVQTSAIIGSVVFGVITDKIGPKKTITITLIIWIAIVLG